MDKSIDRYVPIETCLKITLYTELSIQIRCLPALAFLPIEDVVDAFEELIDIEDSLLPPDLVSYFENTYIGQKRRGRRLIPPFPPTIWNVSDRVVSDQPRTSNAIEAFHNAMNKSVTNTHPSIWKLLDALKIEESLGALKMAQYRAKGREALLPKRKTYQDNDDRIKHLVANYDQTKKMQFLRQVAYSLKMQV